MCVLDRDPVEGEGALQETVSKGNRRGCQPESYEEAKTGSVHPHADHQRFKDGAYAYRKHIQSNPQAFSFNSQLK